MKIQALIILSITAALFAQEANAPAAAPAAAQEELISCETSFNAVKDIYPKDVSANRIYAMVNARIKMLKDVAKENRSDALYQMELKSCELAVEIFKAQLANAAYRKNLDSLNKENFEVQKEISAVKDSLIELWTSDAKGARSLNAALNNERNRLERLNKQKAEEQALLAAELEKKEKALAEKDSLLAAQKAEAEKKLEAMRSKTINVYKDARGTILSMSDILFEFGKADLKPELKENLAEISAIFKNLLTESTIIVEGHTDNVGGAEVNKKLSEQRASAVLKYLVDRGVDGKRLQSVGYGLEKPVANNNTEDGRAKNRRVELIIKDK